MAMRCLVTMMACVVMTSSVSAGNLRIGAFNIQIFGRDKASKPDVMEVIVKVVFYIKLSNCVYHC